MSLSLSSQVVQFLVNSRMVYPPSSTPRTKNQSWLESMGGSASCTAKRSCGREKQCLVASHLSLRTKVKQPQIDASVNKSMHVWSDWQVYSEDSGPSERRRWPCRHLCCCMLSGALSYVYNCVIYSGARESGLEWPIWRRHLFPSFDRPASPITC